MTPKPKEMETIITRALEQERAYDWLGASESYEKALGLIGEHDFSDIGDKFERLGHASFKAARQSETREEFVASCHKALENCGKAKEFYESERENRPEVIRCEAMIAYISYWLAEEPTERKRSIDDCWTLTKKSLNAIDKSLDAPEYIRTFLLLSSAPEPAFALEWSFETREKIIKEAVEHGTQAASLLSDASDPIVTARIQAKIAIYMFWYSWHFIPSIEDIDCHFFR